MTRERPVEEETASATSPVLMPVEVPVRFGAVIAEVQTVETVQVGSVGKQFGSRVVPGAKVADTRAGIREKEEMDTTKPRTTEKIANLVKVFIFLIRKKLFIDECN